jgi:hypothetical protein
METLQTPLSKIERQWGPFASNIRGETLEDKYAQMLQRYEKVINDSSSDNSSYRASFAKAHLYAFRQLKAGTVMPTWGKEKILRHLIGEAAAQIRVNNDDVGLCDAYGIIAVEASRVLGLNNE